MARLSTQCDTIAALTARPAPAIILHPSSLNPLMRHSRLVWIIKAVSYRLCCAPSQYPYLTDVQIDKDIHTSGRRLHVKLMAHHVDSIYPVPLIVMLQGCASRSHTSESCRGELWHNEAWHCPRPQRKASHIHQRPDQRHRSAHMRQLWQSQACDMRHSLLMVQERPKESSPCAQKANLPNPYM